MHRSGTVHIVNCTIANWVSCFSRIEAVWRNNDHVVLLDRAAAALALIDLTQLSPLSKQLLSNASIVSHPQCQVTLCNDWQDLPHISHAQLAAMLLSAHNTSTWL